MIWSAIRVGVVAMAVFAVSAIILNSGSTMESDIDRGRCMKESGTLFTEYWLFGEVIFTITKTSCLEWEFPDGKRPNPFEAPK